MQCILRANAALVRVIDIKDPGPTSVICPEGQILGGSRYHNYNTQREVDLERERGRERESFYVKDEWRAFVCV